MEPGRAAASLAMQSHHILFWSSRLRLSTLSPARRQDLPLDAIQSKKTLIPLHLSACDSIADRTTGALLPFIIPLAFPGDEDEASGGTHHRPAYFFLVFKLSLLTASVDTISAHANDEDRGGGGHLDSPLLLLLLTYHLLFPGCRRSGLSS